MPDRAQIATSNNSRMGRNLKPPVPDPPDPDPAPPPNRPNFSRSFFNASSRSGGPLPCPLPQGSLPPPGSFQAIDFSPCRYLGGHSSKTPVGRQALSEIGRAHV